MPLPVWFLAYKSPSENGPTLKRIDLLPINIVRGNKEQFLQLKIFTESLKDTTLHKNVLYAEI